jgi:U3 small nucleolar RNA-associated protein 14
MSDDESINSDEIPSDKSSESSNEEENQDKALSNLKKTLNLEGSKDLSSKNDTQKEQSNKIYFFENNSIKEGEKNVSTTKDQKIDFSDVFRAFQSDIKNETSRANLSRAVKNLGIKEKKEKDDKKEVNKLKENYEEKEKEKKLERETDYLSVGKDISKYQDKVKNIREADVIDFTQDNKKTVRHIGQKTVKEIAKNKNTNKKEKNKEKDDINYEIEKILINNNCVSDQQVLEKEKEELKNIDPIELQRRYSELRQIRQRLLNKEIENKRKGKIKSKLYHKIKKNKRIKEENELLEQLAKIDPEGVQNYKSKKIIDRVQERMQLKHSLNSKFQKTIKKYHFDKDQQVKEAIKDNFQLRDKLLEKIEGKENEDDIEEEEEEEQEENDENKSEEGINEKDGEKVLVMNFEKEKEKEKKKNNNKENNDKFGVFNMPFMKNAQNNLDIQNKIEKLKNKLNNEEEELDDYDKIEQENNDNNEEDISTENNKKINKEKNNNDINKNKKATIITKDTMKKIKENTKKINERNENEKKVDIKFNANDLQKMIDEEVIKEDINEFNQFLIENDENKKEFLENENKEQIEEIKKNNPEFMPGWGTWAGDDAQIKAKEFLRKKRYEEKIKRLKEQANEGNTNRYVVISNQVDHAFDNQYLVQDLPQEIKNSQQYENLFNTAIGREVNSLNLYKKLIQPKIIKKLGQIINPMTTKDETKAMQLQEIIEKVTKKKKFTKSKL